MPAVQHSYEILIREHHLDTYGHVNNATYLALYEEARWEYITRRGYGFREIHERKMGPVILEVNLTFKKELKLREKINIEGEMLEYGGRVGRMAQRMINEQGEVCSTLELKFGFFDLNSRKLVAPIPEWLHAIGWQADA